MQGGVGVVGMEEVVQVEMAGSDPHHPIMTVQVSRLFLPHRAPNRSESLTAPPAVARPGGMPGRKVEIADLFMVFGGPELLNTDFGFNGAKELETNARDKLRF